MAIRSGLLIALASCEFISYSPGTRPDSGVDARAPDSVKTPTDGIARVHHAFLTDAALAPDFGGLHGADARCQAEADAAGLAGTWLAWLGDDSGDPTTRFAKAGSFARLDEMPIAASFDDLLSGSLLHPIVLTPTGKTLPIGASWTNVSVTGEPPGGHANCANWTSRDASLQGAVGQFNLSSKEWTVFGTNTCDPDSLPPGHLYCFEQ